MKHILFIIFIVSCSFSAFAEEQPYTAIAELIMKYGSAPYGENVFYKIGLPLYSKLGDTRNSSAFVGIDTAGKNIIAKLERKELSSNIAYIAFIVDTCYYDNIIQDLLRRDYQVHDEDRIDMSYGYGTIAHQKIFKSDKVMCIVQTGNNYLEGKIYLYYTFRYPTSNLIKPSASDIEVKDFNTIFDPENKYDTDWNCSEIEPDWLEDAGIYLDQQRGKFYELKPFYDLRNSKLSHLDGITDYGDIIQQPAMYNSLEPIRQINASKSDILERVNHIEYIEPQFPGGGKALWDFLNNNLNIPDNYTIDSNNINYMFDGNRRKIRIVILYDIDEDGKVINVSVLRGGSPEIEKECVRVVKSLPNYIPGTANGKPHKFSGYKIPFNIILQE